MGISDIRIRMNQFQQNPISVAQPKIVERFDAILQKKLDLFPYAETTASEAEVTEQDALRSNELFVENTITGSVPMYTGDVSQAAVNAAYGQNYTTNGQCQQCMAQAVMQVQGSNLDGNGVPTNTGLSEKDLGKAAPYMQYINEASERYGMPVNLILGIMKAESNFNNSCVSYAGAKGLMQLMPVTAAEVGVTDEFDPRQNILGSVEYVTKLINRYDGDVRLALAAYNTGPGKIARRGVTSSTSAEYLTVPQSIRDYADRVLRYAGYQE